MAELNAELIATLQGLDTPTVCNALEVVAPKRRSPMRRGHGYTTAPLVCVRPELGSLVAVARTATIRAAHPGEGARGRGTAMDYYAYIDRGPKPCVTVIQDLDGPQRAYGAFWGEVNSNVHKGLGCIGVITDGSVRDLPDIAEGFQMLADRVGPSHAHVHVVDFAGAVTVAGMAVKDGDLIHADQHGAVVIPWAVAEQVSGAAAQVARREAVIIGAARRPGFNFDRLREAFGEAAKAG